MDEDGLLLNITKTSDKAAFPRGRARVPRSSVSVLEWNTRGKLWRIVGTSAGVVVGLGVAAMIAMSSMWEKETSGEEAIAISGVVGFPVAGYFIGRHADGKTTLIHVVSEP